MRPARRAAAPPRPPVALAALVVLLGTTSCRFRIEPGSLEQPVVDLRGPIAFDMGDQMPDMAAQPDLSGPCAGRSGGRRCGPGERESGHCDERGRYVADRVCGGAGCADGHCRRPVGAIACLRDADCPRDGVVLSCQLFTTQFNTYGQFCAPPPGPGGAFVPCEHDGDCTWNICYPVSGVGPRCLRPCKDDGDCEGGGSCGPVVPVVEGFPTTSNFCSG